MQFFIFGLVFGLVLQPLLDGFTSLILSFFEMIKSYFALKITHNNHKMQEVSAEPQRIIGFDLTGGEEEETDDL